MGHTKDEHFVIELYRATQEKGEEEEPSCFNRYDIGNRSGLNPKAVDAICKLLIQANFIRKSSEDEVYLTDHGKGLAIRLVEEE